MAVAMINFKFNPFVPFYFIGPIHTIGYSNVVILSQFFLQNLEQGRYINSMKPHETPFWRRAFQYHDGIWVET